MIGLRRYLMNDQGHPEINIAPLIDMVFILLIFFLVTTSFVREAGVDVQRPRAATAALLPGDAIQVGLEADGTIRVDGRPVSLLSLRALVRERLRRKDQPVVIISDMNTRTRALVDVIDECRLAGAVEISIAAEQK